jgi:hypothetical protein
MGAFGASILLLFALGACILFSLPAGAAVEDEPSAGAEFGLVLVAAPSLLVVGVSEGLLQPNPSSNSGIATVDTSARERISASSSELRFYNGFLRHLDLRLNLMLVRIRHSGDWSGAKPVARHFPLV